MGYRPGNDYVAGWWFDVREGLYTPHPGAHPEVMTQSSSHLLDQLLHCDVRALGGLALNRTQRSDFLSEMLVFLGYHLDAINSVQSVRILKEVF